MDEPHSAAALRYVAPNPAPARLVSQAADWPWSSARARLSGAADLTPVDDRFARFADLLDDAAPEVLHRALRQAESLGRPLGFESFLKTLEAQTRRRLRPLPRGPKPKGEQAKENEN